MRHVQAKLRPPQVQKDTAAVTFKRVVAKSQFWDLAELQVWKNEAGISQGLVLNLY